MASVKVSKTYQLKGKTDQRLLLRVIAETNKCEFKYNLTTGVATVTGKLEQLDKVSSLWNRTLMKCYMKMAFVQAQNINSNTSMASIKSTFMKSFVQFIILRIKDDIYSRRMNHYDHTNPIVQAAYDAAMEVHNEVFNGT